MTKEETCSLTAWNLKASFRPNAGMLCSSLQHRGIELLRRVENLDVARKKGSTAGIPLLYPWANRLAGLQYSAAGRAVVLDPSSTLLHFDERRLPMHGVPWGQLEWDVCTMTQETLVARLNWTRQELLEIFPYPHHVEMMVRAQPEELTFQVTVIAGEESQVPVSFGFHPYFGLPGIPRKDWELRMPAMRKLVLDDQGIPTGAETPFPATNIALGNTSYDDGFAVADEHAAFSIGGGGYRISLEFLEGFRYAQVFAPNQMDLVALEPMTTPTSALTSGRGLILLERGKKYVASFRILVDFKATVS